MVARRPSPLLVPLALQAALRVPVRTVPPLDRGFGSPGRGDAEPDRSHEAIGQFAVATWCGDEAWLQVLAIGHDAPTVETAWCALEVVAAIEPWDALQESTVVRATPDPDPRVRSAAYRALATRGRTDAWPAVLVHEVVFDPDPAVRALAR